MVHHDTPGIGILDAMLMADMLMGIVQMQLATMDPEQVADQLADGYLDWLQERQAQQRGFVGATKGIRLVQTTGTGAAMCSGTIKLHDAARGIILGVLAAMGADVHPSMFRNEAAWDAASALAGFRSARDD